MSNPRNKKKSILSTVFLAIAAVCLLPIVFQRIVLLRGAQANQMAQDLFYGTTAAAVTDAPTEEPAAAATDVPTEEPAAAATDEPTEEPVAAVTDVPTEKPAAKPTQAPAAEEPTIEPTEEPVVEPTQEPVTEEAVIEPTAGPTPEAEVVVVAANPLDEQKELYAGDGEYAAVQQPREAYLPLLETNPDTAGWLKVSDFIDFPVTKRDNAYYLTHDFFGRVSAEGCAFLDEGVSILPEDMHMIIHGHNMNNGNVFGNLDRFRDLDYLKDHPIITFNTIYEDGIYVPFALFDISANPGNRKYMALQQFNFETAADFDAFVADARWRSYYDIPVDVQYGDQLLSLVTCSYSDDNGRMVFMFRRIRPDETDVQMAEIVQDATAK